MEGGLFHLRIQQVKGKVHLDEFEETKFHVQYNNVSCRTNTCNKSEKVYNNYK